MAKKITMNPFIKNASDLITSRAQTRSGFIAMALEKNYLAVPYVEEAKALKSLTSSVKRPIELLNFPDLQIGLLTASGLSDKSLNYFTKEDRTAAITRLIKEFLEPAGEAFVDELVYRYLLTKGDSLGGKARNLAGLLGERKFLRMLISVCNITGIPYKWKDSESNTWLDKPEEDIGIEKRIKALYWIKEGQKRLLILNMNIPLVNKNIDLSLLEAHPDELVSGKQSIIHKYDKYIALGELKGGIDPAGADEHWKTANSVLHRIRTSFLRERLQPKTFFIGAAIENNMAIEIFKQIENKVLSSAANLTHEQQLTMICEWIISL